MGYINVFVSKDAHINIKDKKVELKEIKIIGLESHRYE